MAQTHNDKPQPEGPVMTLWLSTGLIFTFAAIALIIYAGGTCSASV